MSGKSINELLDILEVRVTDFQKKLADEEAEKFLKRCKQRGLIETYVGDPDNEEG